MNPKKCLVAVFVGALVAFVWLNFSWMALFHLHGLSAANESPGLATALREAAPVDGAYVIPSWNDADGNPREQEEVVKAMEQGPKAFMIILPKGGQFDMLGMMIGGFFIQVVGALIVCFLMLMVSGGGGGDFKRRVIIAVCFGLAVGLMPALSNWNWWSFPVGFTVAATADGLISWTLAGLAMAKILQPKQMLIA